MLSLLLTLFVLLGAARANIHKYLNETLPTDLLLYRHSGMYARGDAPYVSSKDGRSYIKVYMPVYTGH